MSHCDECRRGFLKAGVAGAAVLLVPGCSSSTVDPGLGDDGGSPEAGDDAPGDDGGDGGEGGDGACQATCTTGSKTVEFSFAQFPQLQNVGGSATASPSGYSDPSCGQPDIIVVQVSAGKYAALSSSCSHSCCTVSWLKSRNEFQCPCHGATFSPTGQVTGGPAPTGLQKLSVCADACGVTVTIP